MHPSSATCTYLASLLDRKARSMHAMAGGEAQVALQAVVQGLRWTYSLLWHLCPHQGRSSLVWAEGHYNGAVKTRKTVQPPAAAAAAGAGAEEDSADHAARHRSRQLRELYDWLAGEAAAGGGAGGTPTGSGGGVLQAAASSRRPSAALSPEDLTETEWFFLMSASYSFPSGVGLPGRAFARGGHVWLTGANEVDSKVFLRAILAKTVVCIPIVDGVLEIGTTEKVEEDAGLVEYARSIFMDQHGIHMKPTLSEHSTSNPVAHMDQESCQVQMQMQKCTGQTKMDSDELNPEDEDDETENDDEGISGSDTYYTDTARNSSQVQVQVQTPLLNMVSNGRTTPNAGTSELMQCDTGQMSPVTLGIFFMKSYRMVAMQPGAEEQVTSPENSHYPQTLLTILQFNARRQTELNIKNYLPVSEKSSFSRWNHKGIADSQGMITQGTPQRMLKSILMNAPSSQYCSYREAQTPESRGGKGANGLRKIGTLQGDFSANHVLKERKRREKLNEKFIILRSLVPFMTKMDKTSILGDTIEYVKQLRKRIQDLESRSRTATTTTAARKRRGRAAEGSCSSAAAVAGVEMEVQVSIIESDALLELRCGCRDGLLLRVMQALQELQLEVTTVHASSADGVLVAELRAKVKEARGRRKSSIAQVKRAIHLVLCSP
ncbi:hypothetical protein GUJ93_ZPchr0007g6136 [Zizania palustris]|uniref:BHLH domain-containing protein n=1 Tax=Zizania palustris TaxID=103762 RepID=A0A8J5W6K9_ZIZPA|nr:hypothetical protein GUJ93_ZPchr0007g6136 [Zizania palustris]